MIKIFNCTGKNLVMVREDESGDLHSVVIQKWKDLPTDGKVEEIQHSEVPYLHLKGSIPIVQSHMRTIEHFFDTYRGYHLEFSDTVLFIVDREVATGFCHRTDVIVPVKQLDTNVVRRMDKHTLSSLDTPDSMVVSHFIQL